MRCIMIFTLIISKLQRCSNELGHLSFLNKDGHIIKRNRLRISWNSVWVSLVILPSEELKCALAVKYSTLMLWHHLSKQSPVVSATTLLESRCRMTTFASFFCWFSCTLCCVMYHLHPQYILFASCSCTWELLYVVYEIVDMVCFWVSQNELYWGDKEVES